MRPPEHEPPARRRWWWAELAMTWALFAYCVYLGAGGPAFPH